MMSNDALREWYGDAADVMFDMAESTLDGMLRDGFCEEVLRPYKSRWGSQWVENNVRANEIANQLSMLYLGWERTDDMRRLGEVLMALSRSDWNEMYLVDEIASLGCDAFETSEDIISIETMGMMLTGELERRNICATCACETVCGVDACGANVFGL